MALDLFLSHIESIWLVSHIVYWPILLWALYKAPWKILRQRDSSNIFFASCSMLFLLWHLKVNIADGLTIHLLGATILTLMFRWQAAILGNFLIVLGVTLSSAADLQSIAFNALITGVLPISISYLIWRIHEWYLPANYFIYIFFAAFLAGGVSMIITGVISYEILSVTASGLSEEILDQYLMIFVPIMYPEAFITGAVISIFVIYKPQWIATFDDRRYLHRQ